MKKYQWMIGVVLLIGLAATASYLSGQAPSEAGAQVTIGGTPYHYISGASTNSTNLKATGGRVYLVIAMNTNAAARYVKLYDKATAPTCGTDTPVQTYMLPPSNSGAVINLGNGLNFQNGIGFCITGGMADNDTTAVSANDVALNLSWR